jgi:hypothetical protein
LSRGASIRRIIGTGCNAIRIGGTDEKQERFGNVAIGNDGFVE